MTKATVGFAWRVAPPRQRDWIQAATAELSFVEPEDRILWAAGLLLCACKLRAATPDCIFAAVTTCLCATLIVVDWNAASDLVTLCALVLATGSLGYLHPGRLLLSTGAVGLCLLAAHSLSNFTGWFWPSYQCRPLVFLDFVVLAGLVFPALAAAKAGERLRSVLSRRNAA